MSLSKIVVSGKVIKSPEKRFTPNTNVAVTEFAIAVQSPPRQGQKQEPTPVKVITWRDLAERCAQEIQKGDVVSVDGRIQINNYTTSEGQKRKDVEIDAVNVQNLASLVSEDGQQAPKATAAVASGKQSEDIDSLFASEDEIPF